MAANDTMVEPVTGALIPATELDPKLFQDTVRTALFTIGGAAGKLQGGAATETRVHRGSPLTTTACTLNATTGDVTLSARDGSSVAVYQIEFPNGSAPSAVTLYHDPATHTTLPSTPVSIKLDYISLVDGSSTSLFTTTPDPTTPASAYSAYHGFSGAITAHTVDRTKYKYLLTVVGENDGTNGVVAGLLRGITTTYVRAAGSAIGQD